LPAGEEGLPARGRALPLRDAITLGLVQGPAELLPVSSSAHTALIPLLAGWPAAELDPALHKELEVALHAGAAAALLILLRRELLGAARELDGRGAALLALSLIPPVLVGYTLEEPIERRLNGPRTIVAGLLAGAGAMALADGGGTRKAGDPTSGSPGRGRRARSLADAGPLDGLLLGFAQALALVPGVSRNGATLALARARGYSREDSQTLSWRVALPVILGAGALKGRRLAARGTPAGTGGALAAGALAAFLSTLASGRLLAPRRRGRALLPFALYRCALATLVLVHGARGSHRERLSISFLKRDARHTPSDRRKEGVRT
jgi:undecaprenyl-diphosphatase